MEQIFLLFQNIQRYDRKYSTSLTYPLSLTKSHFGLDEVMGYDYNKATRKVSFYFKSNPYEVSYISLMMSDVLYDMLGFTQCIRGSQPRKDIYILHPNMLAYTALTRPLPPESFGDVVQGTHAESMNRHIHNLFVYSDIVQDTFVGQKFTPILDVVPVKGEAGSLQQYVPMNRVYKTLSKELLSTIRITLLDGQAERIKFVHSSAPVILALHFRKVLQS